MAKRKGRSGGRKKTSLMSKARGGMYIAAKAAPMWQAYNYQTNAGKTSGEAIAIVLNGQAGINPNTKKFDFAVVKEQWGPVAAWTALDMGLSYTGVYKRIGRLLKF